MAPLGLVVREESPDRMEEWATKDPQDLRDSVEHLDRTDFPDPQERRDQLAAKASVVTVE